MIEDCVVAVRSDGLPARWRAVVAGKVLPGTFPSRAAAEDAAEEERARPKSARPWADNGQPREPSAD